MDADETRGWLSLLRIAGIGPVTLRRLTAHYRGAAAALDAGPPAWRRAGLVPARGDLPLPDEATLAADLDWLAADGHHLIVVDDPRYPARLRDIDAAPVALFAIGEPALLAMPQVAIVGSRAATPQGLASAADFAAELTRRGLTVTSGLAAGIDGAAHRGALDAGGLTVAVCATGLDRVYPAAHRRLAREIGAAGLLVSELPPGTRPQAAAFPRRNRIIAGLALGTLVVEAALESGSLITARLAGEQGREVFAIPGSIHNPLARGCHRLIRGGAKLVESADDIVEELRPQLADIAQRLAASAPAPQAETPTLPDDATQAGLLALLGWDACTPDRLAERSGLAADTIAVALMQLELDGWIAATAGGGVVRIPRP